MGPGVSTAPPSADGVRAPEPTAERTEDPGAGTPERFSSAGVEWMCVSLGEGAGVASSTPRGVRRVWGRTQRSDDGLPGKPCLGIFTFS